MEGLTTQTGDRNKAALEMAALICPPAPLPSGWDVLLLGRLCQRSPHSSEHGRPRAVPRAGIYGGFHFSFHATRTLILPEPLRKWPEGAHSFGLPLGRSWA